MLRLLEGVGDPPPPPERSVDDDAAAVDPDRALRCAACRHPIASEDDRVEVHGAHEHRRVNPSGRDFHVGCFDRAPGCASVGEPTLHWTWFPGFAWSMAICRGCGGHLGWRFTGSDGGFYGLILARLIRPGPPGTG